MSKMAAMTLGVWAAALSSAGALAYTLTRPPQPVADIRDILGALPQPTVVAAPEVRAEPAPVRNFVLPTITIVAQRVKEAAPAQPAAVTEKRCSDWRPLAQGPTAQRVRVCD